MCPQDARNELGTCLNCRRPFEQKKTGVLSKFCCRKCYYEFRNKKKAKSRKKVCKACKKPFVDRKKYNNSKFCPCCIRFKPYFYRYKIAGPEALKFWGGPKKCGICGAKKGLCLGHDHVTGKARGLLCRQCNTALGLLKTPKAVRAALKYLIST